MSSKKSNIEVINKPTPTPIVQQIPQINVQSELNLIKAEIRSLRESLESTGLVVTPTESPIP